MTFIQDDEGSPSPIVRGQKGTGIPALAGLSLFLLMVAVSLGPHTAMLKEGGIGSVIRQGSYLGILFLAIVSAKPWEDLWRLICVPLPLVLALLVCAVSLSWSAATGIGLRRLILTGSIAWTIAILVRQLGYERSLVVLRYTLIVLLIANYVAVFAFPSLGIHQLGDRIDIALVGDWCGIMNHKNFAGAIMAFTICFFLFDARRVNPILRIGVLGAAAVFLLFSESKTSVGMLAGSVMVGYLFGKTSFPWRLALIPMIAIGTVLLMIYLNLYRYALVQMVNDPETFTGRIVIWRTLLDFISDNRWYGTGYGSFWNVGQNGPIYSYSADWVRSLATGHNGYLDLAAALGVPLAALCCALLLGWPFVRLLVSNRTTGGKGALLLALLTFCAGHNMTESSILERDVIPNVILMLAMTLLWELASGRFRDRDGQTESIGPEQAGAIEAKSWKDRTAFPF